MFHPILLTGVLLVGLPILLHLIMRQQPKRLPFPAFRFLKMRSRTSQRRIRLQNLLLLLLRMMLIALMALALFQPRLLSDRFHLQAEQPLGAVVVFDTSPSMDYSPGERGVLDEARRRALELLDGLPPESAVAVIDTGDPAAPPDWSRANTIDEARSRIERITTTRAGSRTVTAAVDQAYRLLQALDRDQLGPDGQPLPRFLAVFSDRAAHAWEADRVPDLLAQRGRIPPPEVNAVFVDVGSDEPANLSLGNAEVVVSLDSKSETVTDITVNVRAEGRDFENVAVCRIDGEAGAERLPVSLKAGRSGSLTFRKTGLTPGLHRAEISFVSSDSLAFDNVRFLTFRVPEPVRILALTDDPAAARLWRLALESGGNYRCEIRSPSAVAEWTDEEWNDFGAVCLFNVTSPGPPLWEALTGYVGRGGNLVVVPGGEEMDAGAFATDAAKELMPGRYAELIDAENLARGTTWMWNSLDYQHPVLAPFRVWEQQDDVDFIKLRPMVYRYWRAEPSEAAGVIVSYGDGQQNPALLERQIRRGRVVMFTATMDGRTDVNDRPWNDYLETSFYLVLANLTMDHLTDEREFRRYDFTTGQPVRVRLPLSEVEGGSDTYILDGPGISGSDAIVKRPPPTGEGRPVGTRDDVLLIDRRLTGTAGNFTIRTPDRSWEEGFSLNPPASESVLAKADLASVEEVFGEDGVIAPDRELELGDVLQRRFNQPVDLFPWLMLLLLLVFVLEGLLANRFYRNKPTDTGAS